MEKVEDFLSNFMIPLGILWLVDGCNNENTKFTIESEVSSTTPTNDVKRQRSHVHIKYTNNVCH